MLLLQVVETGYDSITSSPTGIFLNGQEVAWGNDFYLQPSIKRGEEDTSSVPRLQNSSESTLYQWEIKERMSGIQVLIIKEGSNGKRIVGVA